MNPNFSPATSRGIKRHYLFETSLKTDYIGAMFHEEPLDGAYYDYVQWEGLGLPQEHWPLQRVGLDGIRPSWTVRIVARTFTLGIVIPYEHKADDLYNILHQLFPMAGGEFAASYYALRQILGAQFFGLYGFQSGTSVPFSPDGLSFGNTAHPMSYYNQAQTWSNTTTIPSDLSIATAQIAWAQIRTQKRPSGLQVLDNRLARVMVHPNEELVARQIFKSPMERGTSDNNENYLSRENVTIVSNPYFEYSGTGGAAQTPQAFNSTIFQGETHYCIWAPRSDMQVFDRFDNSVMGDVITTIKRFGYGLIDPRGLFLLKGA